MQDLKKTPKKFWHKLKKRHIKKLDIFILTHPHADHIGGASEILLKVGANKIYMPKVSANTKTFEKLLQNIKNQNMKITAAQPGDLLLDQDVTKLQVLGPISKDYEETNDYSIVTKLTIGKKSFLFMGDAESVSEEEMMTSELSLKADVLKVGHHGGKTSTGSAFLKEVMPAYAVILVGKDNNYKHPNEQTLKRLSKIKIYRTDKHGTITITTDGNALEIKTN